MLNGDNELLGDLPGGGCEALSTIWVSLDALHQLRYTLEVEICCSVPLKSRVTWILAVVLLFGCSGRWHGGVRQCLGGLGLPSHLPWQRCWEMMAPGQFSSRQKLF